MTRAPLRGLAGPYLARVAIRPGISFSAISMARRPQSASEMSLILYFMLILSCYGGRCRGYFRLAASRSASARSVFSQGKRERPKWP